MVDNLIKDVVTGTNESYGEKLSGYADHGRKIDGLGKAADYDWAVKGELTLKRMVEFNEALAKDGLPKLSEKGVEGVLALYPYVVAADKLDPQFVANFLETYRAFDGKILREALDKDFDKFTEVPIHNDNVHLGSAITQADLDEVVRVVRGWQGRDDYPGIDAWQGKTLPKGTKIWAGQPGLAGFFVSDQAMQAAAGDVIKLYRGCQIKAHPKHGPRVIFTAFELTDDVPVAEALALANTDHGPGGMLQYYLQNWAHCLKAVETKILVNPNPLEP
jgi:hypothetical protein